MNIISILWNVPNELYFYVDDEKYYVHRFDDVNDAGTDLYKAWPFDQPFHIIMNIAMGGSWEN